MTYLSFSGAGTVGGATVSYSLLDPVNGGSEAGQAIWNSSNNTLTSRTPTKSTNGNAAITGSSGCIINGTLRGEDLTAFIVAGQLLGTATNDSASAGNVGEYVTANLASSSAVTFSSSVPVNITSTPLAAGDWDVSGITYVSLGGAASGSQGVTSLSTTSATQAGIDSGAQAYQAAFTANLNQTVAPPTTRFSLSGTTTVYLVSQLTLTGTVNGWGRIRARRVR